MIVKNKRVPINKRKEDDNMIVCPKCGSKNTAPIIYGMPTEELFEESEKNKVILGGCCITECDDDYGCCDCGFEWSKDSLGIQYVKKIRIKIWNNGLCRVNELKKHVYDIYPDGKVKYCVYVGDSTKSDEVRECFVFPEVVNKLHKEIQHIMSSNKGMLSVNVCDGSSYSLSISYKDNRKTKIEGGIVDYPLDMLLTEFVASLNF